MKLAVIQDNNIMYAAIALYAHFLFSDFVKCQMSWLDCFLYVLSVVQFTGIVIRLHHIPMVKTIVFANIIIILSFFPNEV